MNCHKAYFNWSTGKDSALALHRLLQDSRYSVEKLITTVNRHYNRVSMHGLRNELLMQQAKAMGIPLTLVELPEAPNMVMYENIMAKAVTKLQSESFTHAAFGDIFLEDLKLYREQQLAPYKIQAIFPIWKRDTTQLLNEFLDLGFKSIVVCANSKYFNKDFVGTIIDRDFIKNLPDDVDPCGENGEFHTFCFDGPIFQQPIDFTIGGKIYREYDSPKTGDSDSKSPYGVWYCDLIPNEKV